MRCVKICSDGPYKLNCFRIHSLEPHFLIEKFSWREISRRYPMKYGDHGVRIFLHRKRTLIFHESIEQKFASKPLPRNISRIPPIEKESLGQLKYCGTSKRLNCQKIDRENRNSRRWVFQYPLPAILAGSGEQWQVEFETSFQLKLFAFKYYSQE